MATADARLAAEQAERVRSARALITRVLEAERDGGRVRTDVDLPDAAYGLVVLVHGLGTHAVFDQDHSTPARQRAAVANQLLGLR